MRFKDNIALIIGGASGMGKATALSLVQEGAHVVAFDWQEDKLALLQAQADGPGTLETFAGNVNDAGARKKIADFMKDKFGKIDSMVYAAGLVDFMTAPHNCDDELWDALMNVTVNSAFKLTRDLLPLLWDHEGKGSSVVYISSVGGFEHTSSGTAYVAAKHALTALSKNLAWSYRDRNMRVNLINPGAIRTPLTQNTELVLPGRKMDPEGIGLFYKNGVNILRGEKQLGDASDIASAVCFFLSEDSKFCCGAELTVDGGWCSY